MGHKEESKNTSIDFKTTFSNLVKEEIPEMTQEEAIKNYREDDTIRPLNKKNSDSDDNVEESEHLRRIKQELLASLERVKQLAKRLYSEEKSKSKLNVKEKAGKQKPGKQQTKKIEQEQDKNLTEKKQQDRERE